MVDFVGLRRVIKRQLEEDRLIQTVSVTGSSLEAAVSEASTLLNIPVHRLEYEITTRGFPGILGAGKKEWVINAYAKAAVARKRAEEEIAEEIEAEAAPVIHDVDGGVFVQLSGDGGAFLKVTAPQGAGRRAEEAEALALLTERGITKFDAKHVRDAVEEAANEYVRVGEYQHNYAGDSMVNVEIAEEDMKAFVTVSPPGKGGADITYEGYLSMLKNNGVVHGIDEAFLSRFADKPVYKTRVLIASGDLPVDGRDAYIRYNFETDQSKLHLQEASNGRIDFKDSKIINNVVENQPLARKIPPEEGTVGRTVTGKFLPAKAGKDIPLPLGENVHAAEDGVTVLANINGQVVLAANSNINVEPIYTVEGDVNLKSGNINFLGTVVITGNVEDGFDVTAAGNIEVNGTVGKARLTANGDVIVHQGITGKGVGTVKAGRSIWAKFIENATIVSGNMVVVSDGLINSQVTADKRIICQGKRGSIVGGRLIATEEISAKVLGSAASGTETICEVGTDPKVKARLDELIAEAAQTTKEFEEANRGVQNLMNIQKQQQTLPPEKEALLNELLAKHAGLQEKQQTLQAEIEKTREILDSMEVRGKVSASSKVYPGVKILIREAINDVRVEYSASTFILKDELVQAIRYEETNMADTQAPDAAN